MNDDGNALDGAGVDPAATAAHVSTALGFTKFEHASVGALYMLFCIVGVTLNLLTALTFYKDTKLIKGSQPWLHILLALANVGVVAPSPFPASSSFSGRWLYGSTMCQIYAFEGMFIGIAAIGAVIALCIERYIACQRSGANDTQGWFYGWSITLVLGNALFWAIMPLLGWSRYSVEHTGTSCSIDWKNPDESFVSYIMTLEVFSFGIPMMSAFFCLISASPRPQPQGGATAAAGSGQEQQGEDTACKGCFSEDQLRLLCYVFIGFVLVGWGPFAYLCTLAVFSDARGISMLAAAIPPLACKAMVSAYPLAYAVVSPRFRQSFLALIGGGEKKKE